MTNNDLTQVLVDVRKSYKLLEQYQDALLTLVESVANKLDVTYYSAHYLTFPPRNYNANPFKRSGRDFLPLLGASYFFIHHAPNRDEPWNHPLQSDYVVEFRLVSDTRILDGNSDNSVDQAESRLEVYVFYCCDALKPGTNWYYQIWHSSDYPQAVGEWLKSSKKYPQILVRRLDMPFSMFTNADSYSAAAREIDEVIRSVPCAVGE